MKKTTSLLSALLLSACMENFEGHDEYMADYGMSPEAYAALYPKENVVETRMSSHNVYFIGNKLSPDAENSLAEYLGTVPTAATDKLIIYLPKENNTRARYLMNKLREAGFAKRDMSFGVAPELTTDTARIEAVYAVVIAPECPDWSKSAVTNYTNTEHSNARCALVRNLGLMVEDPRDLLKGQGGGSANPDRILRTMDRYRSGGEAAEQSSESSGETTTTQAQ